MTHHSVLAAINASSAGRNVFKNDKITDQNSSSSDMAVLRDSLVPGLTEAA